jgi:hypothetical protein
LKLKFKEKTRDKFCDLLKDALKQQHWTVPLKITTASVQIHSTSVPEQLAPKAATGGITGIKR